MKVFVTGACGYKGTVLVPKLLERGHDVVAFDIQWFGNNLRPHTNLTVIKGDVRNPEEYDLSGIDAIIHLSSIANDPAGDLDPKLTWEVSCLATMRLADKAKRQGIKQLHLCVVRQRLRHQGRGAGHRRPRAGADLRIQQDQNVRRAHLVVLQG